MRKNSFTLVELLVGIIVIAVISIVAISIVGGGITSFMTDTVTYTVTDKVRTGGESSKYLIFSESETFYKKVKEILEKEFLLKKAVYSAACGL